MVCRVWRLDHILVTLAGIFTLRAFTYKSDTQRSYNMQYNEEVRIKLNLIHCEVTIKEYNEQVKVQLAYLSIAAFVSSKSMFLDIGIG